MQAAAGGTARKGKHQTLSGIRLGKHGMTVSCKSAAAAATAAASQHAVVSGKTRKRKQKSAAHEEALPKPKTRKLNASVGKSVSKVKAQGLAQQPASSSSGSDSSDDDNMQVVYTLTAPYAVNVLQHLVYCCCSLPLK